MSGTFAVQDTGTDWLGWIPATWELRRLGALFRERKEVVSDADFEPLSVTMQGVVPQMSHVAKSMNNDGRKLVRAGDFVINSRSDRKGSGGLSDRDGSVSVISTVLEPRGINPRYAHHLLRSTAFQEEFYRWGSGIVADLWSTRYQAMSRIELPVPPAKEQVAIAEFLDRETSKIDMLIEKQRQLMEKLEFRRSAAIFRAVTKGLGKTTVQDNVVEWLDDVPAHWEIARLNRICRFGTGNGDSHEAQDDGEYPFFLRSQTVTRINRWNFDCEAVMTAGDGQGGVGKVFHYYNGKFDAHQRVYVFRDFRKISPRLFYYYLRSVLPVVVLAGTSDVTMASLRRPMLSALRVAIPPQHEQQDIVRFCERQEREIDELIAKSKRLIELSLERRAALITAAVTGLIDVTAIESGKEAA